jgi:hypothetical protein
MHPAALRLLRFLSPRRAAKVEHREKERATRPAAFDSAYEHTAFVGPWRLHREMHYSCEATLELIAEAFAAEHHPEVRDVVKAAALEGFRKYLAGEGETLG